MYQHLGATEQGDYAFNPGGLLVIGAYREDMEDMVYWYGATPDLTATVTHFWEPDNGDGSNHRGLNPDRPSWIDPVVELPREGCRSPSA